MLRDYDHGRLRRRRLVGLAVAAVLLFSVAGGYLALTKGSRTSATAGAPKTTVQGQIEASPDYVGAKATPHPIKPTADPQAFADDVAQALFGWDTASTVSLSDYTGRLLAVADPSGEESPGLVADIANYLPTAAAWAELRPYYTRQWIEIASVSVPSLWPQAVAEAGPDGLRPGTAAYTIEGVRHRSGVWEGDSVATDHGVAFTVFIVCGPSYPTCHLLRLSRLDKPLD